MNSGLGKSAFRFAPESRPRCTVVPSGDAVMTLHELDGRPSLRLSAVRKRRPTGVECVFFLAILVLLATPSPGQAQQARKLPRLCFLTFDPGTLQTRSPRFD